VPLAAASCELDLNLELMYGVYVLYYHLVAFGWIIVAVHVSAALHSHKRMDLELDGKSVAHTPCYSISLPAFLLYRRTDRARTP
jgi:hypothetical protein